MLPKNGFTSRVTLSVQFLLTQLHGCRYCNGSTSFQAFWSLSTVIRAATLHTPHTAEMRFSLKTRASHLESTMSHRKHFMSGTELAAGEGQDTPSMLGETSTQTKSSYYCWALLVRNDYLGWSICSIPYGTLTCFT